MALKENIFCLFYIKVLFDGAKYAKSFLYSTFPLYQK